MWEAHYSSYNVWKATISVLFQGEENGLNLSRLWRWLSLMGAGCWHGERRRDTQLPETQATAQDPQPFTRGGYCWYRGGYRGGYVGSWDLQAGSPAELCDPLSLPRDADAWFRGRITFLRQLVAASHGPSWAHSSCILQEQRFPRSFCTRFK